MKIINATPHIVNVYSNHQLIPHSKLGMRRPILLPGAVVSVVIEPSGIVLNAKKNPDVTTPNFDAQHNNIAVPLVNVASFVECDPIPTGEDTIFIVSQLYRSACVELGLDTDRKSVV